MRSPHCPYSERYFIRRTIVIRNHRRLHNPIRGFQPLDPHRFLCLAIQLVLLRLHSDDQAQPLSIYDEHKHICSLVAPDGTQILELIIERERGDVLIPAPLPDGEAVAKAWPRSKTKNKGK